MEEIVKHINDTNASFRSIGAGNAKNTDLFLDSDQYELFRDAGEQITVRFNKENLQKAILFIASILPRKYDNSAVHRIQSFSSSFVFDQLALLDAFFTVDGKIVDTRTQVWNARKDVLQNNGDIDKRFYFNGLLEEIAYTTYNGEQRTAKFTIRNYLAGGYSDLHIKKTNNGIFDVWITNTFEYKDDGKERQYEMIETSSVNVHLQQIFYGAPGTGKSYTIKHEVDEKDFPRVRTTFHPDSDYSTFVGAYKPTSIEVPVMTIIGKEQVAVVNAKPEQKIVYEFVPQAFLKAYTGAWKNQTKPFYLIIEEINRGNCAQIFGDLFQLLDRNDDGESDYPISPDEDIRKFLISNSKYGFSALSEEQKSLIPEDIRTGRLLKLPKNLRIWATMNTSDQSLFPIDSAFKRRWNWQYIPIREGVKNGIALGWKVKVNNKYFDWWQVISKLNEKIGLITNSEDKKLGYFFCKANKNIIDSETFVSKVVFYVWNDVFRDFADEAGDLFKDTDNTLLSFNKFYLVENSDRSKVVEEKVELFLNNLGVEGVLDLDNNEPDSSDNIQEDGKLGVKLDGILFNAKTSIETFAQVVEAIGVERVASLNFKVGQYPLLSRDKIDYNTPGGYGQSLKRIGDFWMICKYNNEQKVRFLKQMKNMLNLNLDII